VKICKTQTEYHNLKSELNVIAKPKCIINSQNTHGIMNGMYEKLQRKNASVKTEVNK